MTDDREVFKVRREAGLQKRHELRLESATYTAAEVKVLTEAASRVAYALGRKEVGEEIADRLGAMQATAAADGGPGVARVYGDGARIARTCASQPSPDATTAQTARSDKPKWTDLFGIDPDYTRDAAEEPEYTESDMRVLTEAALRLGRKEAGEEIAAALEKAGDERSKHRNHERDAVSRLGSVRHASYLDAAKIAREIASQPSPDATSGRTDPEEGA